MSNQTVMITGANRGIGLSLTKKYLSVGDKVIACCRNPEAAIDLKELGQNDNLHIYELDVSNDKSISSFTNALNGTTIDILINNAGILGGDHQSLNDIDYDAWAEIFQVNTMSPLKISEAMLANVKLSNNSKIIAISSMMGSLNRKSTGMYLYRSSKTDLNKVMQLLSFDLANDNIIVSMIHPGWVQTKMGGAEADITPYESAEGIYNVVHNLTLSQSGKFLQWNGDEHAW